MVKRSEFKIGDLVVQKYADFNTRYFMICKIKSIEYIDEFSEMWIEDYDEEPYYFYECEVVYLRQRADGYLEVGDVVSYEESDLVSLSKFLNKQFTIQDYVDYEFNGKDIEY
jgi:hypothetical protein